MPNVPRIAVMILTDHPIMRDGLRLRIQQESDMYVVGEAGDLAQTLRDLPRCRPDILLIDLQSPRDAGLRAANAIRRLAPEMPLVLLADCPAGADTLTGLIRGPTAIVPKILTNERIISAIHQAMSDSRDD